MKCPEPMAAGWEPRHTLSHTHTPEEEVTNPRGGEAAHAATVKCRFDASSLVSATRTASLIIKEPRARLLRLLTRGFANDIGVPPTSARLRRAAGASCFACGGGCVNLRSWAT
jgi:hypothetical protein